MQYVGMILGGVMMASFMAIMIPRAAVSADRIGEVLDLSVALIDFDAAEPHDGDDRAVHARSMTSGNSRTNIEPTLRPTT